MAFRNFTLRSRLEIEKVLTNLALTTSSLFSLHGDIAQCCIYSFDLYLPPPAFTVGIGQQSFGEYRKLESELDSLPIILPCQSRQTGRRLW